MTQQTNARTRGITLGIFGPEMKHCKFCSSCRFCFADLCFDREFASQVRVCDQYVVDISRLLRLQFSHSRLATELQSIQFMYCTEEIIILHLISLAFPLKFYCKPVVSCCITHVIQTPRLYHKFAILSNNAPRAPANESDVPSATTPKKLSCPGTFKGLGNPTRSLTHSTTPRHCKIPARKASSSAASD